MEAVFGVIAVTAAVVLFAVFLREYRQRVRRFEEMEARHEASRKRVEEALERGSRLRAATHRPAPPPPPATRYVNDARRPAARSTSAAPYVASSPLQVEEPSWAMPVATSSYDYDQPRSRSSSHSSPDSSSHYAFSGGGGGSFDGGGSSGDWSSSSDSCSSSSSDSGSSSCSSD